MLKIIRWRGGPGKNKSPPHHVMFAFCRFCTRDSRAPLIRSGDGSLLPITYRFLLGGGEHFLSGKAKRRAWSCGAWFRSKAPREVIYVATNSPFTFVKVLVPSDSKIEGKVTSWRALQHFQDRDLQDLGVAWSDFGKFLQKTLQHDILGELVTVM